MYRALSLFLNDFYFDVVDRDFPFFHVFLVAEYVRLVWVYSQAN